MVDLREAVQAVQGYLRSFPNLLEAVSPRLEETEIDEATGDWLITVSYLEDPKTLAAALGQSPPRTFRTFRIDKETGTVKYMKFSKLRPS